MRSKFKEIIKKIFIFYFLNFFSFLIAFQSLQYFPQQHSSLISPQQLLYQQKQQQSLLNNNRELQQFKNQRQIRPSLFDPLLKVKSYFGYLPISASAGTFVQIGTLEHSQPLQILVEDKDLQPGTSSAVYQYILSGYGAERFAVDHQGNLYLADATNLKTFGDEKNPFVLHVIAKEMDTEPQRNSLPITLIIQLFNNNNKQQNYYSEEIQQKQQQTAEEIKQSIYIANVSALSIGERAIAQIKAKENDGGNDIIYRIIDVSDGAFSSFRYDEITNELRAVGPLLPGHKYKVVIEARDSDGLVGHAVVLVQALSSPFSNSQINNQLIQQKNQINKLPSSEELFSSSSSINSFERKTSAIEKQQLLPLEQFISVDLSELTPIGTFVTALDDGSNININNNNPLLEKSEKNLNKYFYLIGDGDGGKFILEPESGILFTGANLDREKDQIHRLRIETRSKYPYDHLIYVNNVKINIIDANDNAPHFVDPQPLILKTRLDELSSFSFSQTTNMLLGKVNVEDADEGENAKISLKVLPPLDRLFTVNDEGELRVNGPLTSAHLGEHYLTLMAIDNGQQPLEARSVVIVRINSNTRGREEMTITTTQLPYTSFTNNKIPKIFNQQNNNNLLSSISSSSSENISPFDNSKQQIITDDSSAQEHNYEKQLFGVLSRVGMSSKNENKIKVNSQNLNQLFPSTINPPPFTRFVDIPLLSNLPQTAIGKITLIEPKNNKQKTKERNNFEGKINNKDTTTTTPFHLPLSSSTYSSQLISEEEYPSSTNNYNNIKFSTISSPLKNNINLSNNTSLLPLSSSSPITSTDSSNIQNNLRIAPIFTSANLKIFAEENEEQLELTKLSAYYPDEGPGPITFVLLAGDQSLFSINSISGIITLLKPLDAELGEEGILPIYFLKIGTIEGVEQQYFDKENKSKIELINDPNLAHFCEIQINVIDINDWIPNFEQNLYEFTLSATAEPGTIVGQVHAFDQDITFPNNKLFYHIIPKKNNSINSISAEQLFSLNPQTGQLKTNSKLKNFSGRILRFGIQVIDGGIDGTELNSTAKVIVHLLEEIKRHEEKKELIKTTTISLQNIESNEEEEKEEKNKNEKSKKEQLKEKQNNNSKQLIKNEEFNKITKNNNNITTLPSISSIDVKNSSPFVINQKRIHFSSHIFNTSIIEGIRPPVLIKLLPIINKPNDTRFTICAIKTGNFRGAFSVAQNSEGNCELRTQMQLDRESISHYLLNITVENGGQQDWTLINITVLDVNDNRPKFVFNKMEYNKEGNKEKIGGPESFFVVLPIETLANQRFYKITAEDGDEPGTGNSLINYSIDTEEATNGEEGNFFGIDPQSGEIWPKKRADELAQISKKNFFRITLIACDNPDENKQRLCSRASVSISLLDDRHRFVLIFSGMNAEQIKRKEKEILNSLKPFTFPCSNPIIERIEDEEEENEMKKYLKRSKEEKYLEQKHLINVLLYSANLKEKLLCLKQEMKKLFFSDTKEEISTAMRHFGVDLLDILENVINNGKIILNKNNSSNNIRSRPIYSAKTHVKEETDDDFSSGVTGLASLLFPIDWSNSNTISALIGISVIVALIALVGLISLCVFRYRHRKMRRHRAEQIRRRHHQHQQQAYRIGGAGGFQSAAGLLAAVNGVKAASSYSTQFNGEVALNNNGGLFNATEGCNGKDYTTGHSCLFGSNNNFYMSSTSSGTPLAGHFERGSKLYESQIRELPVCDEEDLAFIARNWHNKKHQYNCNFHCQNNDNLLNNKKFHPSSPPLSSPLSSNQRLNGSSLLLLPPPRDPPTQPTPQRKVGRRLTNSENAPTSTMIDSGPHHRQNIKHYSPPATIGLQRNQEGDFSIDESFYAANGQSRYIY